MSPQTGAAHAKATGESRPSPREWLGTEPFPWPGVNELVEGGSLAACYCVETKQLAHTKDQKPYLRLQLADQSGTIEGRVWDNALTIDAAVEEGAFVGVRARMQSFRGQPQLRVEEVTPLAVSPDEYALFLPQFPGDIEAIETELDALIASIRDNPLRALLERLLGADSTIGREFRRAPAAKRNHHAYIGGLLEHSVSVAALCDHHARHYGSEIDRDLLVAGALVHDIGKIEEIGVAGGFPYTDEGKLLGHILLGLRIVEEEAQHIHGLSRERLVLLLHLIASHQGKYEWQSPRIPMLLEALILHYMDDLDAKMHQANALIESAETGGWTRYDHSFRRDFLRHRDREERPSNSPMPNPAPEDPPEPSPHIAEPEAPATETNPTTAPLSAASPRETSPPVEEPPSSAERESQENPSNRPRLSEDTLDLFTG